MDHGAVHGGFCTSGMLLTTKALISEHAAPRRDDVLHYLRGSLCRCTGYRKIIEAVLACARGSTHEAVSASPRALRVVGHSVPRVDGYEKVTGRARYVTDLLAPGMGHATILRCPYPHARVTRVDVTRARAHPGALA